MVSDALHIGIDFDNTIVGYDALFHACSVESGQLPPDTPVSKTAVREALRALPQGGSRWTDLQATVYGHRMAEAVACPGVMAFLALCKSFNIRVSIVSHKTRYPASGDRVDLRDAARRWIDAQGLYERTGLTRDRVYFESTRREKLLRIEAIGCTHFIDDHPDVLAEAAFPVGVARILYARDPYLQPPPLADVTILEDWEAIGRHLNTVFLHAC